MTDPCVANINLVLAHYEAVGLFFNPAAFDNQVAPDFIDHQNLEVNGLSGVKKHLMALHEAFPDLQVAVEDIFAEGDRVTARVVWQGTRHGNFLNTPANGKQFKFGGTVFWRIIDGKIKERWATYGGFY